MSKKNRHGLKKRAGKTNTVPVDENNTRTKRVILIVLGFLMSVGGYASKEILADRWKREQGNLQSLKEKYDTATNQSTLESMMRGLKESEDMLKDVDPSNFPGLMFQTYARVHAASDNVHQYFQIASEVIDQLPFEASELRKERDEYQEGMDRDVAAIEIFTYAYLVEVGKKKPRNDNQEISAEDGMALTAVVAGMDRTLGLYLLQQDLLAQIEDRLETTRRKIEVYSGIEHTLYVMGALLATYGLLRGNRVS